MPSGEATDQVWAIRGQINAIVVLKKPSYNIKYIIITWHWATDNVHYTDQCMKPSYLLRQ